MVFVECWIVGFGLDVCFDFCEVWIWCCVIFV